MRPSLPTALAAAFLAVCMPTATAQDLLVQAARLVVAPDTVLTDGRLLVQKGKVAYLGAEIPAEARAKIFEPYFTTKSGGNGLGLATARRIVEAHGGSIESPEPAAGATGAVFRIEVPARPPAEVTPASPSP